MDRIVALQREHDLTLPEEFPFHDAQTRCLPVRYRQRLTRRTGICRRKARMASTIERHCNYWFRLSGSCGNRPRLHLRSRGPTKIPNQCFGHRRRPRHQSKQNRW